MYCGGGPVRRSRNELKLYHAPLAPYIALTEAGVELDGEKLGMHNPQMWLFPAGFARAA